MEAKNSNFCSICNLYFQRPSALISHQKSKKHNDKINNIEPLSKTCSKCNKTFGTIPARIAHEKSCGNAKNIRNRAIPDVVYKCQSCEFTSSTEGGLKKHIYNKHQSDEDIINNFKGVAKDIKITTGMFKGDNLEMFLNEHSDNILEKLRKEEFPLKYRLSTNVHLELIKDGINYITRKLSSEHEILFNPDSFDINIPLIYMKNSLENIGDVMRNSGWVIVGFRNILLETNSINCLTGNSYIDLPFKSRFIVNVQNNDDKCFLWSVLAKLYPQKEHKERISKYKQYENELNLNGVNFPMKIKSIRIFEKNNNLKINVYGIKCINMKEKEKRESWKTYPIEPSKRKEYKEKINLILYENHYILITNLESWISSEAFKINSSQSFNICEKCLTITYTENAFINHERFHIDNEPTTYILPSEKDNKLKFTNYSFRLRVPFIMVADIECLNIPLDKNDNEKGYTHKQIPSMVFSKLVSDYPNILQDEEKEFIGENCINDYVKYIVEKEKDITEALKTNIEYIPSEPGDSYIYNKSTECFFCKEAFQEGQQLVLDHDHYSGEFRGKAHNSCNINGKTPNFIPIFFHNGSGYDFHLFIKELGKKIDIDTKSKNEY